MISDDAFEHLIEDGTDSMEKIRLELVCLHAIICAIIIVTPFINTNYF